MSIVFKTEKVVLQCEILTSFKDTNINSIEDVPVGNKNSVAVLFPSGSSNEFINSMKLGEKFPAHPDSYTEFIMTKEWAESYAKSVNSIPKPLFVAGHAEYGLSAKERPIPDGYVTGAKVINGELYIRNSLPEEGTEEKKALIEQTKREIKAKMLSTSISDVMKYKIVRDETTFKSTYYAIESVKGQSNALVEADLTGSVADIVLTSFKGGLDNTDPAPNDEIIGENSMSEEHVSTNAEMFVSLRNQFNSGKLALSDVAKELGVEILTTTQKTALKRLEDAESIVGPINEFVTKVTEEKEASFKELKISKLKEVFKTDELVEVADSFFSLKAGTVAEIEAEVKKVSELKLFKNIKGLQLKGINYTPGENSITGDGLAEDNIVMEA